MRWPDGARRAAAAGLLLAAAGAVLAQRARQPRSPAGPADDSGETPAVFRRYAAQVVKLQVVESSSGAKAVTGSGFFVTADGLVVTNYHVVSELVHDPDRYRAELLDSAGAARPVRVLAVDAVHDLAVVATDMRPRGWFTLGQVDIPQGLRLYALGHPGDLGLAIVEGTYNGRLPHTLYARIHFTGSLNPGMSGGPTITLSGRVVGVNVSTAGNQQSFLVPADDAVRLLARAQAGPPAPAESLLSDVGRQLLEYQDSYLGRLFRDSVPAVTLGAWRVPTRPADFFNCWGDADRDEDRPWETVHHHCSTDDDVFLSASQSSGIIEFEHDLLTSDRLNRFRFHAVYADQFRALADEWDLHGNGDDDVTRYECTVGNIRHGRLTAKAVWCARRYRRLGPLYDVVFRVAVIGRPTEGLLSTLTLSGVTWANAEAVVRRYLETIAWAE